MVKVYDEEDQKITINEVSTQELRESEENPADETSTGGQPSLYHPEDKQGGGRLSNIRDKLGQSKGAPASSKKKYLAIAGGGGLGFVLIIVLLIILLLPFKNVHFATVLRSAGFARFNLLMKKQFTRTVFDAAVLTTDSTGRFELKDRSLIERLKRVNPEKQLIKINENGDKRLKFKFSGTSSWGGFKTTNTFEGIQINDHLYSLNDTAKSQFGKTYDKLSTRQRWTVESSFINNVSASLSQELAIEGRTFGVGGSVYNALRQAAGISMTKWANKAKKFAGKTPEEARKINLDDTVERVEGDNKTVKSALGDDIDKPAEELRNDFEEASKQGKSTSKVEIKSELANRMKTAGQISTGVFATTTACIIHDLSNSFDEVDAATEKQGLRLGHDALTTGDQIKTGQVTGEAVGAESTRWNGAEDAVLYKQDIGAPLGRSDQEELAKVPGIQGPAYAFKEIIQVADQALTQGLIDFIPGIGRVVHKKINDVGCKVLLNQFVQYGIAGTEIVIAVGTAGTTEGVAQAIKLGLQVTFQVAQNIALPELVGRLIEYAIKGYSNTSFSGLETGADLYNTSHVGVNALEQTGTRQINYGRPLTQTEATATDEIAMQELHDQNRQGSFRERYFALDNPYSLLSMVAGVIPDSLASLSTTVRQGLASFGSMLNSTNYLANLLVNPFTPHAGAATLKQYQGVNQWGFSVRELRKIDTDPGFSPQVLEDYMSSHLDEFDERYQKCYSFALESEQPMENDQPICTAAYLSTDEALMWRVYQADLYAAGILNETAPDL